MAVKSSNAVRFQSLLSKCKAVEAAARFEDARPVGIALVAANVVFPASIKRDLGSYRLAVALGKVAKRLALRGRVHAPTLLAAPPP